MQHFAVENFMPQETKQCQNCKKDFTIESEDFDFYAKIKVPPPTWCWECRLVRRMCFRNERCFYKKKCDVTGEEVISMYSPDKPFKVYEQKYWWSDKWNPLDYGRDYDWFRPFFEQFRDLCFDFPQMNLSNMHAVNSDYCNLAEESKDCYLISATLRNERVLYSNRITFNKDSSDLYVVHKSELCYENVSCSDCYRVFFSRNCQSCQESYFLYNCRNCQSCFCCTNLRNKNYHIFNKPYTKEEYQKKIQEFNSGSFKNLDKLKKLFLEFYLKSIHRYAHIVKSVNVLGDNIDNAKNCHYCFDITQGAEDCKFCVWAGAGLKDVYDGGVGAGVGELIYEAFDTGMQGSNLFFTGTVHSSHNIRYCFNCFASSNLFGCIGIRNKQYCILNKQYTKEEYEALISKIIQHMNEMPYISKCQISNVKSQNQSPNFKTEENSKSQAKGIVYRYGEFFPPELSPFCYNETIVQEYFSLTKEQAIEHGYNWKTPEPRNYQIDLTTEQLPDHIKDVSDSIINKVIECASTKLQAPNSKQIQNSKFQIPNENSEYTNCTTVFKIIPEELAFYRRMNLPLPRFCPNCRHYARLKQRNPLKLWKRQCQCIGQVVRGLTPAQTYTNTCQHEHGDKPCPNTFQTSYAPDRPEIVYCEQCYLKEVV
ncbi:hypothetical protein COT20_01420 [bacterium (Candidatus Gribaldobacteria) CG08_land_8_20_14_0_20_39_15]|uniref:Uncharacterized protein n=1 Tax=bacterium (Candidatus Gribaldobacteria) CG08_land_8_20_14_0_20_39_15 TaxID=2014273 RepID=A0A2M6XUN3_9BACT|nr:MAG: hypothetical protein COT20_01420 [bacterium (Candidatus Gribaldobacteria) CG08_land_8_20_14_0_20_39_15]